MTPRAGGEADKFGNRYEGAWTTRQLLAIIAGRAVSIQIEPFGDLGAGVEFCLDRGGPREVHQVKRQPGNLANWTLKRLQSEGVLDAAARHADAGRSFHFVSTVPARDLDELGDRARRSDNFKAFVEGQLESKRLEAVFTQLTELWNDPERAWERLRATFVRWPDEQDVRAANEALAGALLVGAPPQAAAASLSELALLRVGLTLDAERILEGAAEYGLAKVGGTDTAAADKALESATDRWLAGVEAELLDPRLARSEAQAILRGFDDAARVVLAVGAAGTGKTVVLHEVAEAVAGRNWPVLAIRLDRSRAVSSARELGEEFELSGSPVASLAAVAGDSDCLLILDQLDAVSLASGRMATTTFDAVAETLRQAAGFPRMRVLLAARRFDVDNDHRLRGLIADRAEDLLVEIGPLDLAQVDHALEIKGLDPAGLTAAQRELLRIPLNLSLLYAIAEGHQALSFSTARDLMDAFWDRKRRECDASVGRRVMFEAVVQRIVDEMSARQRLAVPAAVLDPHGLQGDADVLRSAHVLVSDGRLVAFFHETFFDYAFARAWTARGEPLLGFLLDSAQELFRRAQVRQVLLHMRDEDPERFRNETADLLRDERVRFHLKDVVIAILQALADPSAEDWSLVQGLLVTGVPFEDRLWRAIRTRAWFVRLDDVGLIQQWLSSERPDLQARALETMAAAADSEPERMTRLLASQRGHVDFGRWFRWLATWLPFDEHRELFDLLLDSVGRGEWDDAEAHLGMVAHKLGEDHPSWACELLSAWLKDRPNALNVDGGRIAALDTTEHGLLELARSGAAAAREFVDLLLPYVLEVMRLTEYDPDRRPVHDVHFGHRVWRGDRYRLEDVLLFRMAQALAELSKTDASAAARHVDVLALDRHDGAQWLLYEALRAAPSQFARRAAAILLEGEHRLYSGYTCDSFWTTRQLLEACGPHFSDDDLHALETALLGFAPEWESLPGGYSQFTLLSGLPEQRLSERGRRRLGELRRQFNTNTPDEPRGIMSGFVGPPVPLDAIPHMSDDDWIRVAAKHAGEREDFTTFTGGAREQANVLAQETEKDPSRFAQFGLRLGPEHNPAYLAAILRGLGQAGQDFDPENAFALIRHAAEVGDAEFDRWLGWALRRVLSADIPDDIIELVLNRARHAAHPETDVWLEKAPSGEAYYGGDPFHAGMNSDRGESALVLGDILAHDLDGHRTQIVAGHIVELAADSSVAVRSCVAHVINAALRYAPADALNAFEVLVDADERLLATDPVERLIAAVGFRSPDLASKVVERMLSSVFPDVREAGGRLAGFLGLEADAIALFECAVRAEDEDVRAGVALVCAERTPIAPEPERVETALAAFFDDESKKVREAAARVAGALRDRDLDPHRGLLKRLIASAAFSEASTQLLITLDRTSAPIADVALEVARRFLADRGDDVANIATRAAGDSRDVAELLLRVYAQSPTHRGEALDLIDRLLLAGAWGVADVVGSAER